ncbi:GUN4 domain-containing protein [Nodularia harveyana UHCC-0300]|uniref:GUN4 domain-containing protein n=1 Tax=Nodularia harveyana UHCC-0300 TaxID=2974287 RepID=A0ABU5UEL2_9CYAN|nr:GUN4 domain-containing protein [Nodularia harveyana]MEA5581965.1 GUN4 domain-containing protein [Nodularia harveyana UHCC-0300]
MAEVSLKLFFSYSHKDESLRDELAKHLTILERQGVISGWYDRKILPGQEWDYQINDNLKTADIILLLVSSDFLFSNYCWDVEVKKAIERHDAREACVIPVILRSVDWTGAPFAKLGALPKNAEPVVSRHWHSQDEAFTDVAKGIRTAVEQLKREREEIQLEADEAYRLQREKEEEDRLKRQQEADRRRREQEQAKQKEVDRRRREQETDDLSSDKGVDYRRLRDLLKAGKWKQADQETLKVMLKAANREGEGWLNSDSIEQFPCTDLRTIDQLWVKYSNGCFGFSVQKRIYESVGEDYEKFGDRIGWRRRKKWLYYSELTFSQNAPGGHLPAEGLSLAIASVGDGEKNGFTIPN